MKSSELVDAQSKIKIKFKIVYDTKKYCHFVKVPDK